MRRLSFPHSSIMIHESANWASWHSMTAAAQHLERLKEIQDQMSAGGPRETKEPAHLNDTPAQGQEAPARAGQSVGLSGGEHYFKLNIASYSALVTACMRWSNAYNLSIGCSPRRTSTSTGMCAPPDRSSTSRWPSRSNGI